MSAPRTKPAYLSSLEAALGHPRGPRARRALREVEDHLEDAAGALEADGMGRAEAEALAISRFGAVDETARALIGAGTLAGELPRWHAAALWGGLILSIAAGLVFVVMASISGLRPAILGTEAVLLAVVLAAFTGFARLQFGSGGLSEAWRRLPAVASLLLTAAGLVLALAALVSGSVSGDFEYYLFVRAGVVCATGLTGVLAMARRLPAAN